MDAASGEYHARSKTLLRDFLPGLGMGKISGSGSRTNNPDHITEISETIFLG
jgi:hypothetical protein